MFLYVSRRCTQLTSPRLYESRRLNLDLASRRYRTSLLARIRMSRLLRLQKIAIIGIASMYGTPRVPGGVSISYT